MDQTYMKEKPVVPLLLSMGIPVIISMIAGALYNIVDSIFVAMISEDAMTAVSLVYPIQNLAHAAGVGFGVGINAMVARRLGEGKTRMANQTASQGVFLSALHGMILTILGMVEEIVDAQWQDLGMPETLWHCRVKGFGPLIVSIDTEGRNLFEENKVTFNERKEKALKEICKHVSFIK